MNIPENIPKCDNVRSITAEYDVIHGELNVETGILTLHSQRPRTNADRIRSMSDEDLAKWGSDIGCHPDASVQHCKEHFYNGERNCKTCWLDWLGEEENT